MAEQGLEGTAAITAGDKQYVLIRTEPIGLAEFHSERQPGASASPARRPRHGASASPATVGVIGDRVRLRGSLGQPAVSAQHRRRSSASAAPSASPAASASPSPGASAAAAGASPGPSSSPDTAAASAAHRRASWVSCAPRSRSKFGPIDEVRQQATIGPLISAELAQQAVAADHPRLDRHPRLDDLPLQRLPDGRDGASSRSLHDVIVVVGTFAILGTFIGLQVDALFVTAMLTVIGFSVHDTIVVYDRIRENRIRHAGEPFDAIVNHSLLQTVGRSLNTSLTTSPRPDRAAAVRQRCHARLRLRDGHRHPVGDVLVDLQRQRPAGRLAPV